MIYILNLFLICFLPIRSGSLKLLMHLIKIYLFVYLVIFHGMYFEIGGDWLAYQMVYANPSEYSLDFVYVQLLYFFKQFFSTNAGLNTSIAFIYMLSVFNLSSHPKDLFVVLSWNLSYLMPIVLIGYNRQALAIGFLYFLFSLIIKSPQPKWISKIFLGFTSIGSHSSAAFAISVLGLIRFKTLLLSLLPIIFYLYYDKIFNNIIVYSNYGIESAGFFMRSFCNFMVTICCFFILPRHTFERKLSSLVLGIIILMWVLNNFFTLSVLFDRLNLYLTSFVTIFLLQVSKIMRETSFNKWRIFASFVWLLSVSILAIWLVFADNKGYWMPYRNIILEIF